MGELWTCMDQHLASRHAVAAIEARLAQLAHQLRAVQKRMLLRFKDKQPASLAHLDLLIQETFIQLQDLGGSVYCVQHAAVGHKAACGLSLTSDMPAWPTWTCLSQNSFLSCKT